MIAIQTRSFTWQRKCQEGLKRPHYSELGYKPATPDDCSEISRFQRQGQSTLRQEILTTLFLFSIALRIPYITGQSHHYHETSTNFIQALCNNHILFRQFRHSVQSLYSWIESITLLRWLKSQHETIRCLVYVRQLTIIVIIYNVKCRLSMST